MRLNFADIVEKRFGFLLELGFVKTEALPTMVRYRKGDLELSIYLGRQSYEVGFEIGHANETYSMSEIIRATDPGTADQYRNAAATTATELATAVDRLAGLVTKYGERALRDDPAFFAGLSQQRKDWSETYALDVLAQQVRPKAEAAFREGRFREAAELYEKIHARLTPAELKKLDIARQRG
ncbi:hypothetical protein SAMN05444159_4960 [Bradyrhizobium lablabi]|uniref:Uncharacterized protein n=2 Tax=Bradyrhizobium lablabi TaxID=722472 RepID=A0A1M6XSG0_9BRAD|nr:hypothetical protein SAMN05444159_4960 [Bradyrhizobium lablabi]